MLKTSFLSLMVKLVLKSGETAGVPKVRKQLWVSTFGLFLQHMKHLWAPNPKASSGQTVGKGQDDEDHTQHLAFAPE